MPTRADHQTGRWTMSFMGWEALPEGVTTLAEMLAERGLHTAASVDTPYYIRDGMNYDRGFQSFFMNRGQDTMWSLVPQPGYHSEGLDVRAAWHNESDRNAPKTFMTAIQWLEHHYKEDFFLYVDTWDPARTLGRARPTIRSSTGRDMTANWCYRSTETGTTCRGIATSNSTRATPPTAVRSQWSTRGSVFC